TTAPCETFDGMVDASYIKQRDVLINNQRVTEDEINGLRPDNQESYTAESGENTVDITIDIPGEASEMGNVTIKDSSLVEYFEVFYKGPNDDNFKPFNPDESNPTEPK
ncbi:unnamed protein product, partial [Owenia fusiformis]